MSKKLIPFSLYPYSWGMKGKTRDIAEAEYSLTGYELEQRLLDIKQDEYEPNEFKKKSLEIKKKWNKIDDSTYYRSLAELIEDKTQRELSLVDIDFRENKISEIEHSKKVATIKGEHWVRVINMDFNHASSLEGSFELDWNDLFLDKLKSEGYVGHNPDDIVNQWFISICRNVAMEEFDGTGDFTADSQANLETLKRWNNKTEKFGDDRKGYK